uniref:Predicted protein n=1 Tax=Physcomitrium patens TaxID=3218 RepID=A9U2L9_PHYPA
MHKATRSQKLVLTPPLGKPNQPQGIPSKLREPLHLDNQLEFSEDLDNPIGDFIEVILDQSELTHNSTTNYSRELENPISILSPNQPRPRNLLIPMASGGASTGGGGLLGIPINPLVQPWRLPIVVLGGLPIASIPPHLPLFKGTRDEYPSAHVERFIEILTTCLITDVRYFLVWFPTTLKEGAYEWYRNHPANTFVDWDMLQRAFLEEFRPEVVTRFVSTLLTDDTLKNFFIQGFSKETTIREILNSRPQTLADAKRAARVIEQINKEHDRIWRKEDQNIPNFIPIHAQGTGSSLNSNQPSIAMPLHSMQQYPTLLDTRLPAALPVLTFPEKNWREEMKREMQSVQQGFQDQISQQMKLMTDQMAALARIQNFNPPLPPIESENHSSGLWCTRCGQPGHTFQFCNENPSCWLESQVVCGNCGGNHPTNKCRKRDKVFPLQPPPGNYVQQGYDNRRGERQPPHNNTLQPPNLYYDYNNNRQNHHPPTRLQINRGFLPMNQNQNRGPFIQNQANVGQGSQDARFINQTNSGMIDRQSSTSSIVIQPIPPESNLIRHELLQPKMLNPPMKPALAIMTRSRAANMPSVLEEEESLTESPPRLSELEDIARKTKETINNRGEETLEFDPLIGDLPFQLRDHDGEPSIKPDTCDWKGPAIPKLELIQPSKTQAQSELGAYDLWADLGRIKADITITQFLEISPIARKILKLETSIKCRRKAKVKVAARMQTSRKLVDMPISVTTPNIQRQAQMKKPGTGSEPQLLDITHHVSGCIGPGLYDWKDDGQFAQWLEDNPHLDLEHTTCYIEASMRELEDGYPGLAIVIDDIIYEDVCHLTIDGTQFEDIDTLLKEKDLLPPLHVRKINRGLDIGTDLSIYPPIPSDWYRGPTKLDYAKPSDWKSLDVSLDGEDPKPIKIGSQLTIELLGVVVPEPEFPIDAEALAKLLRIRSKSLDLPLRDKS